MQQKNTTSPEADAVMTLLYQTDIPKLKVNSKTEPVLCCFDFRQLMEEQELKT